MRSLGLTASICIALAVALYVPQLSSAQYSISSVAGGGPTNLPKLKSSIGYTESVAFDSAGNAYVSDSYSNLILKVSTTGTLTIIAGNGTVGYSGDGGPATGAALNGPEAVAVDASGNIFIADTGNFVIREVAASSGDIQTVAGNGIEGYSGDGGPATSAQLDDPYGVFVDAQGDIFIADTDNFVIREVAASNGNIQTIAGTPGISGYSGDGGAATSAQLAEPEGVFVDGSGNIFIADTYNSVIREVTIINSTIQTVAGKYYSWNGSCNYSGDGGPATSAQLCLPDGVFVDSSENIYIADTNNVVVREVAAASGNIETVAGNNLLGAGYSGDGGSATGAQLNYPSNIAVDSSGDIFIADTDNFVVREVTAGNIQTFAGNNTLAYSGDGGPATGAELNIPGGVFVDGSGDLFIADTASSVIREVLVSTGDIQTVAGNGIAGYSGDGGLATSAQLNNPSGVFVDGSGNIFIADTGNSVIREVVASTGDIQTVAGNGTPGYAGDGGPATSAELSGPYDVLFDGSGNIYLADTENSAVRVVNTGTVPTTIAGVVIQPGNIATVAGNGNACSDPGAGCGDGGAAISAALNFPGSISLDAEGDILIADTFDNAVREVNASSGVIQTVVGILGTRGYAGDNGPASSALLDTPFGVFVDSLGNIFIADTENSAVREVVGLTSTIQTIAGNGVSGFAGDGNAATAAQLAAPLGVVGTTSGTLFIADTDNSRIRQLSSTVNGAIFPGSATLPVGGPQQFLAVVTGTKNSSVTWRVNNVTGGNSKWGTISSLGSYRAPSNLPSPSEVTVAAISDANGYPLASVQVKIVSENSPAVTVSTSPSGVTEVYTRTTQTFNAAVSGENNTAVNWQVNGIAGGNSILGTITSTGLYSAPSAVSAPAVVTIGAVSQANQNVSGAYPLLVVTVPSASQPAAQTISPGGNATYSISLNANTGDPREPITLSCLQSSLPTGALCTFSPKTITPSNTGVPFTLTVTVPSGTASLTHPSLMPQLYFAFMPLAGFLLIGGSAGKQRRRWLALASLIALLLVLTSCGGGGSSSGGSSGGGSSSPNPEAGTYTIEVQGTTVAQPNPVVLTTAGLTVQ
jgi:hypothetical protein